MTNLFDVLDLPRSLLIEPSAVEAAWEDVTRNDHPDVSDTERDTADANQARNVLTDPVTRLEHWLALHEIELRRDQSISPELMDLFAKLNPVLSEADAVIAKMKKASTALAKAMLAKDAAAVQLKIQELLGEIMSMKNQVIGRYGEFEKSAGAGDFTEASESLAQLKFLKKWEQQGQTRLLTLLSA